MLLPDYVGGKCRTRRPASPTCRGSHGPGLRYSMFPALGLLSVVKVWVQERLKLLRHHELGGGVQLLFVQEVL